MTTLNFTKLHGLGNDFVLIDSRKPGLPAGRERGLGGKEFLPACSGPSQWGQTTALEKGSCAKEG